MRNTSIILLLSLMLIPLVWNGVSLMHYLGAHTHTFCESEQDHQHTSTEDCHTICNISSQSGHNQFPQNIEFYKLKLFITAFTFFDNQCSFFTSSSTSSNYAFLTSRILSEDIFRPPIS